MFDRHPALFRIVTRTGLLMACAATWAARGAETAKIDFGRDILPILSNNRFHCHGPEDSHRKGQLRLDTYAGVLGAGKSGATAGVPGKSNQSDRDLRISSPDDEDVMPPRGAKEKLTPPQIALLPKPTLPPMHTFSRTP
jgi:hypothetical protein